MSGTDAGRRARLACILDGEQWLARVRPRRSLLPAATFWGLAALLVLHPPSRTGCSSPGACTRVLAAAVTYEPVALAVAAGAHLLAAGLVYALAVAVTVGAGRWVDLRERAPRLFAPDDGELRAVAVVLVVALVAYVLATVAGAYTVLGIAAIYLLYFPLLVVPTAVDAAQVGDAFQSLPEPVSPGVALGLAVLVLVAQVLWLYVLAHGGVRAVRAVASWRRDEDRVGGSADPRD